MNNFVSLLNHLEPGIVIFDGEYRIRYINRMILTLFNNVAPTDIFSRSLLKLHHQESVGKIKKMLDLLNASKRQIPFSIKILLRENQYRYLFIKLIDLVSYQVHEPRFCALMYDITAYISDKSMRLLKIPVGIKNEIKLIDLEDVIFVEADNVYSRVYTEHGGYFSGLSIGMLYDRLPHKYFFRIHRSYLINLTKVSKVFKDGGAIYINFKDHEKRLPVSRNRSREFLERLGLK